jgi:adenosine deaminase
MPGRASTLQLRHGGPQVRRGGRRGHDFVRGRRQWLCRVGFAGYDPRSTDPCRVQGRRDLRLETVDRIEGVVGRGNDRGIRSDRDLRAGSPAPERHEERDRAPGREEPPAYHAWMDPEVIRRLPKAELHQHLDGSVRPETAVELAADIGLSLTLEEAAGRMVGPQRCEDQAELLTFFDLPISLLQTAPALERAAAELVEDLAADGVRYAEIRWAPRLHLERGLSVGAVIDAVATGVSRASTGSNGPLVTLIVTAMRSHPPAANADLAQVAGEIGGPVVGFDLAGPEAEWPAPPHAIAFVAAREAGLALTAHAGEVSGAHRVREVLDFGVRRVAHGVTAIEDPALMDLLRARDVTLDMCPTSNVQAGIVPSLAEHPVAALHRAGVSVTLSTDDRTVTGITLSEELARSADALDLSAEELSTIALNGFARAFASPSAIAHLFTEATDAWHAWSRATIS